MDNYNARKLYYLSQLVELFVKDGLSVGSVVVEDMVEVFGINDRAQLAYAAKVMRKRINHNLMMSGVSMEDPESTYISPDVKIGKDTVIFPNTTITGSCNIGVNNLIGPNTILENVKVGDGNTIKNSTITKCEIGNGEVIKQAVKGE